MKRYPDALVRTEADVEGIARDVVPPPTVNTYRVVTLTKTVHGCVGVTTVRVRQPNGQTTDVQGFSLPDALRRLASLVDREQGYSDVRGEARVLILDLCTEIDRLSGIAKTCRAQHEKVRLAHPELGIGSVLATSELDVADPLWKRTTRLLGRLRDELALDEALAPPDDEADEEMPS